MTKVVYLSGPMSGIAGFNIPQFDRVARMLRNDGFTVVSPAELDDPDFRDRCLASSGASVPGGSTWGTLLARDVKLLADDGIEAVVVLPGWESSRGARLEVFVALLCKLSFYRWNDAWGNAERVGVDWIRSEIRKHIP